jgi:hypothetical protein
MVFFRDRDHRAGADPTSAFYDADDYEADLKDDLLEALQCIEQCREKLNAAAARLGSLLSEPLLQELWSEFSKAGGLTSRDLQRYLDGKIIRYRPTRQKKHLRLVTCSKRPKVKPLPYHDPDDDEAA